MFAAPEPRRKFRATHLLVALIVAGVVGYWVVQTFRRGSFMADASGVTIVTLTRPADGETGVLPNAFITANLNEGHAIDPAPDSLGPSTVRLYRTSDGKAVPAQISTSAAGDDIVLTPIAMLEPATKYTFEVNGVKDMAGAELMKFKMSFTTSGAGATTTTYPAAFEKIDLPGETNYYTALAIGPDHRLYASTVDGKIIRREITTDGTLGSSNIITTVPKNNAGPRLITGIRFDPKATADHLSMWVSHGQFIVNQRGEPSLVGATEWTGKISLLSGGELDEYRDVVINLPRSWRDHLNNQIDFGPDGCMYFSQGSHTAMGAPDKKWGGNRVERLLSAAVLRLDPAKVPTTQPVDVKTPDGGGSYDPFAPNAPLTIYASGVRVGYDMLWHSNGHLYTATNGSAAGGYVPATPADHKFPRRIDEDRNGPYAGPEVIGMMIPEPMPDLLLKLEAGGYYGHPNPLRAEYVMLGGNPTSGKDLYEVSTYPVGTKPDRNWRKPAYDFGISASPNGMIEFQSGGKLFAGALDGKMMIARLNANDILVLALDSSGDPTETITGITGLTSFTQPLDLAEDAASGCIYVAEYRGEKLALLRPVSDPSKLATLHQNVFRQQLRAAAE
jgi:hypothetical protein